MTNSADRGGLCGTPGVACSSGDWRQAYVTNTGSGLAQQSTVSLSAGSFTATVPGRSQMTFRIQ